MLTLKRQWKDYAAIQLYVIQSPVYRRAVRLNADALCMIPSKTQAAVFESLGLPSLRECIQDTVDETQRYLDYQNAAHARYLRAYRDMRTVLKQTIPPVLQAHDEFKTYYGEPVMAMIYSTTTVPYYPLMENGASKPYMVLEALADGLVHDNPDTIRGIASSWLKSMVVDGRIVQTAMFEEFLYKTQPAKASVVLNGQDPEQLLNSVMTDSKNAILDDAIRSEKFGRTLAVRRQTVVDALDKIRSRSFTKDMVEDLNKKLADYSAMTFGIMTATDILTHVGRAVYESAYVIHTAEVEYDKRHNQ